LLYNLSTKFRIIKFFISLFFNFFSKYWRYNF